MKNQVKRLFNLIVICIFALCANAQESAEVVRFNNKTHQKETLCTVHYKTVGNVFYVDTPFSYLGIVFSDNKTNKYAYEKSLVLKKDKNTNWYSVKLDNSQFGNTTGRHISAIIVRNCKSDKVKDRQCYDAYLYNNTAVIASWKGSPELNKDTKNIIKHLEKQIMNRENETYENDVQLYDKTDDFDVNCDSTEDEEIYPEEMDYELPGKYNSEKTIAVIGILLIFVFCLIVFILCSLTR